MPGSDLYVGTLDTLILKSVSGAPQHGYAIGRWIRNATGGVLEAKEGALYPALHRLERKGWLSEKWGESDTGREAKFYSLTPRGRKQLQLEIARWTRHSVAVSTALQAPTP